MKPKLVRFLLVIAVLAIIAGLGRDLRELMNAELTYQSFWHYVVRLILIIGAAVAVILVVQLLAVRNPAESIGVSSTPTAGLKLSNVAKRITDILVAATLLTLLSPVLVMASVLIFILEG